MTRCRLVSFYAAHLLYLACHQIATTNCFTMNPFVGQSTLTLKSNSYSNSGLCAKHKRRRKDAPSDSYQLEGNTSDVLPDFDLDEEALLDTTKVQKNEKKSETSFSNEISPNMMGSTSTRVRSIKELIADRSSEKKMEFDLPDGGVDLPELTVASRLDDSSRAASLMTNSNRKKERQLEARRLAAIAAEKEKEDEERRAFLKFLPGLRDESGKISPVKILETGTWTCIVALITWEVYINSPFFERAAPMAPVVY